MDLFISDDSMFTGLYYQDKLMKFNFQSYPEVLMIDPTYKLNDLRMPLYILLIVDGNGQSEVVSMCLTSLETKENRWYSHSSLIIRVGHEQVLR